MIKLMTDKAADITKETAEELGIEILPFIINVNGKALTADINLSPREFYGMIKDCEEIPTTSQMSPVDVEETYRRLGKENTIIHVTMSAAGSGINNTSNMIASQLNDEGFDITVIDSATFSLPIGGPVIAAAKMARDGKTKQEIIEFLEGVYARNTAYILVDDLTFLKKGGRIKATTMAISKVLDIKPILTINDGLIEAVSKVRGLKKGIAALVDYVEERMEAPEENELVILDSDAADKVEILENMIKERINPKSIFHGELGPVITAHIGTGVVAVYFKHKKPYTEYK